MSQASPLRVMSTLGVQGLLRDLLAQAEAEGFATACRFDPTARLLDAIRDGARADVAILTAEGTDALVRAGVLEASPRAELARSVVGLAVRAGAPRPEIGTVEACRAALLAAPSIVYSRAGASGTHFAALIGRLGIAAEVNAKATVIPHGFTAEPVARGEAALAVQQVSELMAVPGVDVIGALPAALNTGLVFSAAVFAGADPLARRFVPWLAAVLRPDLLRAAGLEPV